MASTAEFQRGETIFRRFSDSKRARPEHMVRLGRSRKVFSDLVLDVVALGRHAPTLRPLALPFALQRT